MDFIKAEIFLNICLSEGNVKKILNPFIISYKNVAYFTFLAMYAFWVCFV